jgi:hypothetical protein
VNLASIDSTLARLRDAVRAMSTNMVDLETDAGRTRLDQSPLTGATAKKWAEAKSALAWLWQWFTQLNEILDQATTLRGTRPKLDSEVVAQLDRLVNGPSIELSTADVPLSQRGLFGAAETTIRCSPPELLDRMRVAFDQVVAVIGACSQKWNVVDSSLCPLEDQLAEAERLADDLGETHRPELDQVRSQLDRLRQASMCDPLAAPANTVEGVAATLGSATADLRRLHDQRDNLATSLSDAGALMVDLRKTSEAAVAARTEALAKIAHPAVVDAGSVADSVEVELQRVLALSAQGDWRGAGNLLARWNTRCRDALAEAHRALAANRAPLAVRDELRGRLDAYRAKAYRLGRLEDPDVAASYARAQSVLFTAPTDLTDAEQLVRRFQQTLTGSAPREVAT